MKHYTYLLLICILSNCTQQSPHDSSSLDNHDEKALRSHSEPYQSACLKGEDRKALLITKICSTRLKSPHFRFVQDCTQRIENLQYDALSRECKEKISGPLNEGIAYVMTAYLNRDLDLTSERTAEISRALAKWFRVSRKYYEDYTSTDLSSNFSRTYDSISGLFKDLIRKNILKQNPEGTQSELFKKYLEYYTASLDYDGASEEFWIASIIPALESIKERADIYAQLNDSFCRLSGCTPGRNSSTYEVLAALGSLFDTRKLEETLSKSYLLDEETSGFFDKVISSGDLVDRFMTTSNGRISLYGEANFLDLSYDEKLQKLDEPKILVAPVYLQRFISISREAAVMAKNYKETGNFYNNPSNRLDFRPSDTVSLAAVKTLTSFNENLKIRAQKYKNTRKEYLQSLISNNIQNLEELDIQKDSLSLSIANLSNDLDSLRDGIVDKQKRMSSYFQDIENISNTDLFQKQIADDSNSLTVSANNTRYNSSDSSQIMRMDQLYSDPRAIEAEDGGRIVNIRVTGEWSPICALKKDPNFSKYVYQGIKVGPSGFHHSISKSGISISSESKSKREINYEDRGTRVDGCLSAGFGKVVKASVSACKYYSKGKRNERIQSSSQTNQQTENSSYQFASGLRLYHTPFSEYSAGSLLAVVTDTQEQISSIRRVVPVQNQSSIILNAGEKLSFIVNDCSDRESSGELTVSYSSTKSESIEAEKLLYHMVELLGSDKEIADRMSQAILSSGANISSEVAALRSLIRSKVLASNDGVNYLNIPELQLIFNSWLDNEMLQLDKKHQIKLIERQMKELDLKLLALNAKLSVTTDNKRLTATLTDIALTNLDINYFTEDLSNLLQFTERGIGPILNLYYPSIKGSFASKWQSELSQFDYNSDLSTLVDSLSEVFDDLIPQINAVKSYRSDSHSQYQLLVIRVPRPELVSKPSWQSWPMATMAMRRKVWKHILSGGFASQSFSLDLNPQDLYKPLAAKGRLACYQTMPIIDSMALGLILKDKRAFDLELLNASPSLASLNIGPRIDYVGNGGLKSYRLVDHSRMTSARRSQIPVGFGTQVSHIERLIGKLEYSRNAGYGLSPFSTIQVSQLSNAINYLKNESKFKESDLTELALVFKVKVSEVSDKQDWISSCN